MSCVVRPFNTIVGSAAIKESILSMKSMPADGKSNSVTGRNRRSSCKGGKCAKSGRKHMQQDMPTEDALLVRAGRVTPAELQGRSLEVLEVDLKFFGSWTGQVRLLPSHTSG